MSDTWRCFVAVPIGDELRAALSSAVARWREQPGLAGLRWSDPAGWHLTLAFLGAVDPADLPRVTAELEAAVTGREASEHSTGGLGAFPSASRARIAWYGVADPAGRLRAVADAVRRALVLPDAEPFRGHMTLGRARSAPLDLRDWVAWGRAPAGSLIVDRLELMRSHLGGGPARYEVLATMPLGLGAHV